MKLMNLKKNKVLILAAIAAVGMIFNGCASTDVDGVDPAITDGIAKWNSRGPEAARAYWEDIEDPAAKKKYLGYIDAYNAGIAALDSTDGMKGESKLLNAVYTAVGKLEILDPQLEIDEEYLEKGADLSAARVLKLLEAEKASEAKKLFSRAKKVFGENDAMANAGKVCDVVNKLTNKKAELKQKVDAVEAIEDVDERIKAYNSLVASLPSLESSFKSEATKSGVTSPAITNIQKSYTKLGQDVKVQRESAIREKAYNYKEEIGAVFARQPEGTGSGKNGAFTNKEILAHYTSVSEDMEVVYGQLLEFRKEYPKEIGADVIADIENQKKDLNDKIAIVKKEIAHEEEVKSRGKTCMPLMIGLFNPAAGDAKKSRPAGFKASNVKGDEYWWGMVSIPKGEMNDLVITMKDNRTVRVFNENTKSGKRIEKDGLKNLVSMQNKVGNSWPVMNAGAQLKGSNYFFEVQKGKTDSYAGEVVVYSSFITRSR